MATGEDFKRLAEAKKIKPAVLAELLRLNYDSEEALSKMSDEQLEALEVSQVQSFFLMSWVKELRRTSTSSVSSTKEFTATLDLRAKMSLSQCGTFERVARQKMDNFQKQIPVDSNAIQVQFESNPAVKNLADHVDHKGLGDIDTVIHKNVMEFMNSKVSIAVCGESGSGKSSLLNCILNKKAKDEGAAKTGLKETTRTLGSYQHPDMPGIVFWDVPGVNTPNFPKETYLEDVRFDTYDAFIIVGTDRMKDNTVWLVKEAHERRKPFYFVRSKIDFDIGNFKREEKGTESDALSEVRRDVEANLIQAGIPTDKVYLVSGVIRYQTKWDFPRLMEDLMNQAPEHNATALIMALVSCSIKTIEKKKSDFKRRINVIAAQAATDHEKYQEIIKDEIQLYIERFGCREKDLDKWDVDLEKAESKLKQIKSGLLSILERFDSQTINSFIGKLASNPLFSSLSLVKSLFKRAKAKLEKRSKKAKDEADNESSEVITEAARKVLSTALDKCAELAEGILRERGMIAQSDLDKAI